MTAPLLVIVRAEGYAVETLGPYDPPLALDVRLERARRLEGRVTDSTGTPPVSGWVVVGKRKNSTGTVKP